MFVNSKTPNFSTVTNQFNFKNKSWRYMYGMSYSYIEAINNTTVESKLKKHKDGLISHLNLYIFFLFACIDICSFVSLFFSMLICWSFFLLVFCYFSLFPVIFFYVLSHEEYETTHSAQRHTLASHTFIQH